MLKDDPKPAFRLPLFSVIIPVYNAWKSLEQCLLSLEQQANCQEFEVIVVDDGSKEAIPDSIAQSVRSYPLAIVRQSHAGIAAARNRGLQISRGLVSVFSDADCRFQMDCLAALRGAITDFPQHNCFQLHLRGDDSNVVGRAEGLRLIALQDRMLRSDGCIQYLNTAGFAIRRAAANINAGLFDPAALRAEDTMLLANLMQRGELPFFVANGIVQHVVSLSLMQSLRKDVRSAWLEGRTYEVIAAKGVRVRMSHKERLNMLLFMWRTARHPSIGRVAWFVLVVRQSLQRVVSLMYRCMRVGAKREPVRL
jgi:glycosyltransferase involved in cell wall biosynthesis